MTDTIERRRRCLPPPEFVLHIREITLTRQSAGAAGEPYRPRRSGERLLPVPRTPESDQRYRTNDPGDLMSLLEKLIKRLHEH